MKGHKKLRKYYNNRNTPHRFPPVDQTLQQAITLHQAGNLQEAERLYRAILEVVPKHPDANHNLGQLKVQINQTSAGLPHFKAALEANPNYGQYWLSYINALIRAGRHDTAHQVLAQAQELGLHGEEVETLAGRLLQVLPADSQAKQRKPESRHSKRDTSSSKTSCQKSPGAKEMNTLAALFNEGRYPEAEHLARKIMEQFPGHGSGWKGLGTAFIFQGRKAEALAPMKKAAALLPEDVAVHYNLGNIQLELGRPVDAEASYRRALELIPEDADAHNNLAIALKNQGRLEEAKASYRRALEIEPFYAEAYSNLLLTLNHSASHHPSYLLEEARGYGRMVAGKVGMRFSAWDCMPRPERLRVGMVSADLRNHPVGFFLESVLAQINPSCIELIAYPTNFIADELSVRIKPYFSAWKPLGGLSDEAAAGLIHADGVNLLLDLSGHTSDNRLPIFAWKPAPVQASWLGYFATTGVTEMDYLLADEVGVPRAQRGYFTETVWYLPDTRLCFSPPDVNLAVADPPALKSGRLTFGCFQCMTKIGDGVLAVWGEILNALPGAGLRLQCEQLGDPRVVEQLVRRLQHHGIDRARVSFHGRVPRKAYLAAHAAVDMLLDTFPYPGGTTTCDALWMGVPTLTLAGESLLARQGASLLIAAGLAEWVAAGEADYVAKAIAIASDQPKLALLRTGLRQQVLASPLFDAPRFARHFEAALWGMWERLYV